jgi:mRNA interferase RelE/StbE
VYEVRFSGSARKSFERADNALQRKLVRCFEHLRRNPHRHPNIKSLRGEYKGYSRFRVGDHRVIYRIDDEETTVHVALILHRSKAY